MDLEGRTRRRAETVRVGNYDRRDGAVIWARRRQLVNFTLRVSLAALLIGNRPDQLGPRSKSTSGRVVPSTKNSEGGR